MFNLIDEPWIPCFLPDHVMPQLLRLPEVFAQAHLITQLADPSPPITVSLHRFLLVVLHRAFQGPTSIAEWATHWHRQAFTMDPIHTYLRTYHERFDLFDPLAPFYQTPGLVARAKGDARKPASQLIFDRASERSKALLFDHRDAAQPLTPDLAARALLATQAFSPGGLVSFDDPAHRSAHASPLAGCAVCLVRGQTLFQTLLLNWQRYELKRGYPFQNDGQDLPAWERTTPTCPEERIPGGYADLLTWQSRCVQVIPTVSPNGALMVSQVVMMKGFHFPPNYELQQKEPMVPFRFNRQAKVVVPWLPVSLRIDRFVWRDSDALFRSVDQEHLYPRILDWIRQLSDAGILPDSYSMPLEVLGIITDRARMLDWRHETLSLAPHLLNEQRLTEVIKAALARAEWTESLLRIGTVQLQQGEIVQSPTTLLCTYLLQNTQTRAPKLEVIKALATSFDLVPRYWSKLDPAFRVLLDRLPQDHSVDAEGVTRYGEQVLDKWNQTVSATCHTILVDVFTSIAPSTRAYRAVACAEEQLSLCLRAQ